jgi:hypothetical protein
MSMTANANLRTNDYTGIIIDWEIQSIEPWFILTGPAISPRIAIPCPSTFVVPLYSRCTPAVSKLFSSFPILNRTEAFTKGRFNS